MVTEFDAPMSSLRDRVHERTRQEIAGQALALCSLRGFDAVTVDDIAQAAGVSRRTFFRYFETKEDALLPDDASRIPRLREALASRPDDESPWDSVRAAILAIADDYDTDSQVFLERARLVLETPSVHARGLGHQAVWEGLIREYSADRLGEAESALLPHLLAAACMAALRAALVTWLDTDGRGDLRTIVADALDVLAPAFCSRCDR